MKEVVFFRAMVELITNIKVIASENDIHVYTFEGVELRLFFNRLCVRILFLLELLCLLLNIIP